MPCPVPHEVKARQLDGAYDSISGRILRTEWDGPLDE
jgi:hypothetical protein